MRPRQSRLVCSHLTQAGFSLVEVAIVAAIVLLVAIIGIPAIGNYVIEHKVPKVGEALQRFAIRTKINGQGGGATPYLGIDTTALALAMRDNSVFDVSGSGASSVVAHGLGGRGMAGDGVVTLTPVSLDGIGAGAAFSLTLTNVSHIACPGIASVMQSVSARIGLTAAGGAQVVKDATASPAVPYSASRTANICAPGDVNTFVFTIR